LAADHAFPSSNPDGDQDQTDGSADDQNSYSLRNGLETPVSKKIYAGVERLYNITQQTVDVLESKMKAAYLDKKAGVETLVVGEIPTPRPGSGEVLVKVHATAIMPAELQWVPTFSKRTGEPRPFPIVLSHEFSGVVESVGSNVSGITPGEAVYGLNDWFANGAQAEYCVVQATALAPKPKSLDHLQSAVAPISALTAWQGLFDKAALQPGQRVLIHGAAGGVGSFAVQLAHGRGVFVAATSSSGNRDFVRSLGADQVIDYRAARFEDVVRNMDVVFDGVGGDTLERSWGVLKPGGKVITFSTESGAAREQRTREAFMLVQASSSQLRQIGELIDGGKLRVIVAEVFPLAKIREAYARARQAHPPGKIAVRVLEQAT
jgi:NADPH:quinone reductase-like Zn-dependent oxidoreductase